jgi:hypothetical protein
MAGWEPALIAGSGGIRAALMRLTCFTARREASFELGVAPKWTPFPWVVTQRPV